MRRTQRNGLARRCQQIFPTACTLPSPPRSRRAYPDSTAPTRPFSAAFLTAGIAVWAGRLRARQSTQDQSVIAVLRRNHTGWVPFLFLISGCNRPNIVPLGFAPAAHEFSSKPRDRSMAAAQPARFSAPSDDIANWMAERWRDIANLRPEAEDAGRRLWALTLQSGSGLDTTTCGHVRWLHPVREPGPRRHQGWRLAGVISYGRLRNCPAEYSVC